MNASLLPVLEAIPAGLRAGTGEPLGARQSSVVLVVDADAGDRHAFRRLLGETCRVLEATDGRAALAIIRSRLVDLALLDIFLPDENGLEVLQELKAIDPTLPVIVVTGVSTVRSAVTAMKLGAFEYLTKPYDDQELLRTIRNALGRQQPASGSPPGGPRHGVPRNRYVRAAVDYLTTSYEEPLTVEAVARAVGVSWSHLAHLFRAETGVSVRAYLRQRRVEAAIQRIANGDDKLAEVARQVGFCDASHLTRTFLRVTGRRPSNFRQQGR